MPKAGWNLENTYAKLPEIFYRNQNPTPAPAPQIAVVNQELASTLGLAPEELSAEIFAGSMLPPGAQPICQAYAGYQFGHFAMLGDGRAVLLGEQVTPTGHRFDIQLKGSGPTPFSRGGDGYAAILPMLREYIVSEAMFYLGIPTTRSLAVVLTGRDVIREKVLQGAVLTRVAASHIRVGTFNYIAAFGTKEDTRALADYCIWRHFPWLLECDAPDKYVLMYREVAARQAALIANWQLIGFVHGVMNTDNMAISGETIDYGPCAFMDIYDPDTVFSSIDIAGRYAYKNQPAIGAWNLARLAEALLPLFHESHDKAVELASAEIDMYWGNCNKNWLSGMRAKLGIVDEDPEDVGLADELLGLMAMHKLDYTTIFRDLMKLALSSKETSPLLETPQLAAWLEKWQTRLSQQNQSETSKLMNSHNPAVIPRNHRVEESLAAAEHGDYSLVHKLLTALRKPYEESDVYSQPPGVFSCSYKTFCGT